MVYFCDLNSPFQNSCSDCANVIVSSVGFLCILGLRISATKVAAKKTYKVVEGSLVTVCQTSSLICMFVVVVSNAIALVLDGGEKTTGSIGLYLVCLMKLFGWYQMHIFLNLCLSAKKARLLFLASIWCLCQIISGGMSAKTSNSNNDDGSSSEEPIMDLVGVVYCLISSVIIAVLCYYIYK